MLDHLSDYVTELVLLVMLALLQDTLNIRSVFKLPCWKQRLHGQFWSSFSCGLWADRSDALCSPKEGSTVGHKDTSACIWSSTNTLPGTIGVKSILIWRIHPICDPKLSPKSICAYQISSFCKYLGWLIFGAVRKPSIFRIHCFDPNSCNYSDLPSQPRFSWLLKHCFVGSLELLLSFRLCVAFPINNVHVLNTERRNESWEAFPPSKLEATLKRYCADTINGTDISY